MLKSARNTEKGPEGRMPLADHLRELRNRLAKAVLAIVIVTAVAAVYYNDVINFFTKPVLDSVGCPETFAELAKQPKNHQCAQITINGLLAPFTLAL
ncbi:twin-arginine translocase subunit TatC, partial [Streptomyces sp. NPDC002516]